MLSSCAETSWLLPAAELSKLWSEKVAMAVVRTEDILLTVSDELGCLLPTSC
jgi:hypothetical protein